MHPYVFSLISAAFFLLNSCVLPDTVLSESRTAGPLGYGNSAFSQEMETDRPDFTEGTQTIDPGHVQLESGYTYYYDKNEDRRGMDAHVLPELLIRLGFFEEMELRLSWPGYVFDEAGSNGTTDFSAGYKQNLLFQDNYVPDLSYIFEVGIPAGSDNQTADEAEPALKLLWAYEVSERISAAGNLNIADRNGEEDRYIESSASTTLSYSISEHLGAYTEYFGIYPDSSINGEPDQHYINSGFTYGISENLQLDIRAGLGLNSDAADFFSGAGLSYRI